MFKHGHYFAINNNIKHTKRNPEKIWQMTSSQARLSKAIYYQHLVIRFIDVYDFDRDALPGHPLQMAARVASGSRVPVNFPPRTHEFIAVWIHAIKHENNTLISPTDQWTMFELGFLIVFGNSVFITTDANFVYNRESLLTNQVPPTLQRRTQGYRGFLNIYIPRN